MKQQHQLIALLLGVTLMAPCWPATKRQEALAALDELAAQYGLVKVEKKNLDLVYKRPDATLSKYRKVKINRIAVDFSKNFDPIGSSKLYQMNPPDLEKIKSGIADLFAEVFKKELEKSGYEVVNEAGPDVLEVRAAIVNLYITAPDISMQTAGRVRTYTTDAGEMTLVMELCDSLSGTILAQVLDRRAANTNSFMTWTNSVTNRADAQQIIGRWGEELRKAFDASRAPD